tara:strand:+ start:284 stop:433 length:150 start_codon:yes stop_codon:yes gene_type:complete
MSLQGGEHAVVAFFEMSISISSRALGTQPAPNEQLLIRVQLLIYLAGIR